MPRLLTIADAAARIGVHPCTVRRRISDGTLPAFRVGGQRLIKIRESDLDRLLPPVEPKGVR